MEFISLRISFTSLRKFILFYLTTKILKMKPESILKADLLDIVFENRNKDYGAYELRKYYAKRLSKSIIIIFSSVAMLLFSNYLLSRHHFQTAHFVIDRTDTLTTVQFPDRPREIRPQVAALVKRQVQSRSVTTPLIVKDSAIKTFPVVKDLDNVKIGTVDHSGEKEEGPVGNRGLAEKLGNGPVAQSESDKETVLVTAEKMPEFPGGMDGLKRFLSRNLRSTHEMDPGTAIRVQVKFVVDKDGNVTALELQQSGGKDFDSEVIRVLKKMPRWQPGMQNGIAVAVYYYLPVIFQSQDEN